MAGERSERQDPRMVGVSDLDLTAWGLPDASVTDHSGGMNSRTWLVEAAGRRFVAKAVLPAHGDALRAGLIVAAAAQTAGIPAGAAVPTLDGDLVAWVHGRPTALLRYVAGEPLAGTGPDVQRIIGTTLASVHNALSTVDAPAVFHWVDPAAEHLGKRPWLRNAITEACAALDQLDVCTLTVGALHTDPSPEAFRWDPSTGRCGLIDWSVGLRGPLLYDLASAAMYVGGPVRAGVLIQSYLDSSGVMGAAEVQRGMATMTRFRWAVQADYFAGRIARGDLTGIAGPDENEIGLEDARQALVRA
jgi:Ser/Thr protein kinase RdoA (MazF antagonist)